MSKRTLAALSLVAALGVSIALAAAGVPVVSRLAQLVAVALVLVALLWGLGRLYQRALWKVGRRLAFSYLLVGIVPIPLALLLLGAVAYLGAGFLLGHVYGDAVGSVRDDLGSAARTRLALAETGSAGAAAGGAGAPIGWALYRGGWRVAGDDALPDAWPAWAGAAGSAWFVGPGEAPTLTAVAGDGAPGVVAYWTGDLAAELRRRAGVWVDHLPPSADTTRGLSVNVGDRRWTFQRPPEDPARTAAAEAFFAERRPGDGTGDPGLPDKPFLLWGQLSGPVLALADGSEVHAFFFSSLQATPRGMIGRYQSPDEVGIDAAIWAVLLGFAFLLFDAYAVAAIMAAVMIYTLSRAVNRLSRATEAVRAGDFSVRIPVKRRDQVGALQRSFNQMAGELEHLVAAAADQEALEKELQIARELQRSLLPRELPGGEAVEFSTLFAPSAAIGGDYFDVLGLGDGRLAVVIADVSGHGLPSGLRMAMLKAALTILVEEEREANAILGRLHDMVRSGVRGGGGERRVFVTATLALADLAAGTIEITNAGHPPTYLLRAGAVEEIALPGSPLGGLGTDYGRRLLDLLPGDVLVWLSDGLIDATDAEGRPFGYGGVTDALAATAAAGAPAALVRDRLLAAVERHTGGRPVEDDRTVVVMRYKAAASAQAETAVR